MVCSLELQRYYLVAAVYLLWLHGRAVSIAHDQPRRLAAWQRYTLIQKCFGITNIIHKECGFIIKKLNIVVPDYIVLPTAYIRSQLSSGSGKQVHCL